MSKIATGQIKGRGWSITHGEWLAKSQTPPSQPGGRSNHCIANSWLFWVCPLRKVCFGWFKKAAGKLGKPFLTSPRETCNLIVSVLLETRSEGHGRLGEGNLSSARVLGRAPDMGCGCWLLRWSSPGKRSLRQPWLLPPTLLLMTSGQPLCFFRPQFFHL